MLSSVLENIHQRIRATFGAWDDTTSIEQMRQDWDELFARELAKADTVPVDAGGVSAQWISAPGARDDRVLLYLHGGGYVIGSVHSHRDLIARLSAASGCRVLGLDYRLAPEHPFPAPVEDATAAYRWLLDQGVAPAQIAIAGDSAGGGLTAATLLSLRDAGTPLPAAAVMLSPWVDLEGEGASMKTRADVDPMVKRELVLGMAETYLAGGDPRQPLAAPLHAALEGLPPLLIHVGDHETLLDDSVRFAEKARVAGVDVTLEVWGEMVHVWHLFADELPQAQRAIERVGEFLRRRLP